MRKVNLSEAGGCLAELIEAAGHGEEVIITQSNGFAFKIVPILPELLHGKMINFNRPAKIAFSTLLPEDRRYVIEAINQLGQFSDRELGQNVKKLALDSLYMTKAGDLRIIFRVDDDGIEIEDVFHKNRLNKFGSMKDKA